MGKKGFKLKKEYIGQSGGGGHLNRASVSAGEKEPWERDFQGEDGQPSRGDEGKTKNVLHLSRNPWPGNQHGKEALPEGTKTLFHISERVPKDRTGSENETNEPNLKKKSTVSTSVSGYNWSIRGEKATTSIRRRDRMP